MQSPTGFNGEGGLREGGEEENERRGERGEKPNLRLMRPWRSTCHDHHTILKHEQETQREREAKRGREGTVRRREKVR